MSDDVQLGRDDHTGYDYSDRDECIDAEIEAQEDEAFQDADSYIDFYADPIEERAANLEIAAHYGTGGGIPRGAVPRKTVAVEDRSIRWSVMKTTLPDGTVIQGALGHDVDAIRAFLEERAGDALEDLCRPTPAGRLTDEERARRVKLSELVVAVRDRGATLEAIGAVLNRPPKTVHVLEKRGRELAG